MVPRERISFEQAVKNRSRDGQKVKEWEPVLHLTNIPAKRISRKSSDDSVVNAGEEFVKLKIVFWMRYNDSMNDSLRIIYNGSPYRIIDIDRKFPDNSCNITCVKINE